MFEKVTEALESAENRYNIESLKLDAYVEAVMAQYEINCKKAELKVMKESGTVEDYWYLQEAAGSSVIESLKNAIKKIIDTFKKYVNELKLKVLSLITSSNSKDTIDKIDKKIRFNPFLSKKKVQVKDSKKVDGVFAWVKAEIRKLLAKVKSGKEVKNEDVSDLKEEFNKKLAAAVAISAAVTIGLGAATIMIKKKSGSVGDDIKKTDEETVEDIKSIQDAGGPNHEGSFGILEKLAALRSDVGKKQIREHIDSITGTLQIIKSNIFNKPPKGAPTKFDKDDEESSSTEEPKEESVEDSMYQDMKTDLSDYFGESETDNMLKEMEADLFAEDTDVDTDNESDDDDTFLEDFEDLDFSFDD